MKRLFYALALCILVVGGLVSVGCGSNEEVTGGPGGQDIPEDFAFAGHRYMSTGDKVAEQHLEDDTPTNVLYVGSSSQQGGEYDVYLIQGVDENEAIALRICPGGGYWYMEYERLSGQQEPASFSYQGRAFTYTGEVVGIARLESGPGTLEAFTYLYSVVCQGTTYDAYSIEGVDQNQAIALRIAKSGKKAGFCYYYFRYKVESTTGAGHECAASSDNVLVVEQKGVQHQISADELETVEWLFEKNGMDLSGCQVCRLRINSDGLGDPGQPYYVVRAYGVYKGHLVFWEGYVLGFNSDGVRLYGDSTSGIYCMGKDLSTEPGVTEEQALSVLVQAECVAPGRTMLAELGFFNRGIGMGGCDYVLAWRIRPLDSEYPEALIDAVGGQMLRYDDGIRY